MSSVRFRFQVSSLDGAAQLPDNDDIDIVADGGFGQFLVKPTGASSTFATLGLIAIGRLLAKAQRKTTNIDGVRVQALTVYDESGVIPVGADVAFDLAETFGSLSTPVAIETPIVIAVPAPVRRIIPGWPMFGSTSRLRIVETGAPTTFWSLFVVVQALPELACCLQGEQGGGPG